MIEFKAQRFLTLAKELGRLSAVLKEVKRDGPRPEPLRKKDKGVFEKFANEFDELGLPVTKLQARRIIAACDDENLKDETFRTMLAELFNRMADECTQLHFLCLSPQEIDYFMPVEPLFGNLVEDKMPQAIEDIAEAGKCLAIKRATAAVFHLMRVMEIGVQKFGDKLGVQLTDEKVWQVILDGVNAEIKKLGKNQHAKDCASISAHLYNVKLAWRNEAMHPKATYTLEEANGIFSAVRQFTNELAGIL